MEPIEAINHALSTVDASDAPALHAGLQQALTALGGLRDLYEFVEIDPDTGRRYECPEDGPSGADTCQELYTLFNRLGWPVT